MATGIHRPTARVLDVLELLSRTPSGLTLSDIARILDVPKSTLSPIMHTLEARQFITADPAAGLYRIGVSAFFTGATYQSERPALDYIQTRMQHITNVCGETCHLGILSEGQVLYVAKVQSPHPVSLRSLVGRLLPAYCTGIGKSLLIRYTLEQLQALYPEGLERHTPTTITSFEVLEKELQDAVREGFTYEHGEYTEGIECVAVPLFSASSENPVAALSISVPAYRFDENVQADIKRLLLREQSSIEYHLRIAKVTDQAQLLGQSIGV